MPARLTDRDPIFKCWRVAAIHRCVVRHDKDHAWAQARLRELDPSRRKDHLADNWFRDIHEVRAYHRGRDAERRRAGIAPAPEPLPEAA